MAREGKVQSESNTSKIESCQCCESRMLSIIHLSSNQTFKHVPNLSITSRCSDALLGFVLSMPLIVTSFMQVGLLFLNARLDEPALVSSTLPAVIVKSVVLTVSLARLFSINGTPFKATCSQLVVSQ